MNTYDWIVVGAGITGAAVAYELAKQGLVTLLLEPHQPLQGASRYGYGGIAYWAGTTALTRQICAEGLARHRLLSAELEADTEFRELDLLLTIAPDADPNAIAASYAQFAMPPQLISPEAACELEPLLNPAAIAAALWIKHGHISPQATAEAYCQAFQRLGGTLQVAAMTGLVHGDHKVTGITTTAGEFSAAHVLICAGGLTRRLLQAAQIRIPHYFTHAELIETPPVELELRTMIMPAVTQRFQLEADATQLDMEELWDEPGYEPAPPILDAGAIQMRDGRIRIGQTSRSLTDPEPVVDPLLSEAELRTQIGHVLPSIATLPGTWCHCLVAFSRDRLPLVGAIPGMTGLHVFSGFSNPLAIVPSLAQRFAQVAAGRSDAIIDQLSPGRFGG
jgi:glycine/D-amino acid oxidase-like deaminating enzyme